MAVIGWVVCVIGVMVLVIVRATIIVAVTRIVIYVFLNSCWLGDRATK